MPVFDPHRPHSEVHGIVGIRFLQDGRTFNSSGEPVADPENALMPTVILGPDGLPVAREVVADEGDARPLITPGNGAPIEQPPEPTIAKDDMRLKENKLLKIQWEQYHEGENWPGPVEARRILGVE